MIPQIGHPLARTPDRKKPLKASASRPQGRDPK